MRFAVANQNKTAFTPLTQAFLYKPYYGQTLTPGPEAHPPAASGLFCTTLVLYALHSAADRPAKKLVLAVRAYQDQSRNAELSYLPLGTAPQ